MSHTCSQTSTTRLHLPTWLTPSGPPLTPSRKAPTALQNPPRLRATRTRQADRPRSHGRALPPAYGPTRLPGGPASAHSRQGRSSGGRRGRRAAERAASEPSRGQSTRGRVGGPHRSTRLERLGDLESRRAPGGNCSRARCACVAPSATSPRRNIAPICSCGRETKEAHVSVCMRG